MAFIHNSVLLKEKRSLDLLFSGVFSPPFTSECLFSLQLQLGLCAVQNSSLMAPETNSSSKRYPKRFRLHLGAYLTNVREESYVFMLCLIAAGMSISP